MFCIPVSVLLNLGSVLTKRDTLEYLPELIGSLQHWTSLKVWCKEKYALAWSCDLRASFENRKNTCLPVNKKKKKIKNTQGKKTYLKVNIGIYPRKKPESTTSLTHLILKHEVSINDKYFMRNSPVFSIDSG
ncbi:hypothetical protein BD770DRAFT_429332 [Pilaira anomala]|nr:hypothetical protein BD770DRAFT_429332 [Pilaira anomala]